MQLNIYSTPKYNLQIHFRYFLKYLEKGRHLNCQLSLLSPRIPEAYPTRCQKQTIP